MSVFMEHLSSPLRDGGWWWCCFFGMTIRVDFCEFWILFACAVGSSKFKILYLLVLVFIFRDFGHNKACSLSHNCSIT